ncbi:uncharacterized protein [Watersipora subatra]|uniref:uncharacterized protein n=1 Tax=Watersipora subatra TaxID=2589382 RepID=UPI00355B838A
MSEEEMESESKLLYPTIIESDEEGELPGAEGSTYLFPDSEFEPDSRPEGVSKHPETGRIVRNHIVQDIVSLLLRRVVPNVPDKPRGYKLHPVSRRILTRDEIIKQAMEQARRARSTTHALHTQPLLQPHDLNRTPKLPPIKPLEDLELQEMIARGKSKGYSDAAFLRTRRDNQTRRLLVPSKEEAETVDIWRLEEQYRTSIKRLKGYSQ